jgi:hypothetical protein
MRLSVHVPLTTLVALLAGCEPQKTVMPPPPPPPPGLLDTALVDWTGHGDVPTIQAGLDTVVRGGVVIVRSGTYSEAVYISKGLTLEPEIPFADTLRSPGPNDIIQDTTTDSVHIAGFVFLAPDTGNSASTAIFGRGRINLVVDRIRAHNFYQGVYADNDSATTGGRGRLVVRDSRVDVDAAHEFFASASLAVVDDMYGRYERDTVSAGYYSCLQVQSTATADVLDNVVRDCGYFRGGIRASIYPNTQQVNIIGNTVLADSDGQSPWGIYLKRTTGVVERNTVVNYVTALAEDSAHAAGIVIDTGAVSVVRFNDISGNRFAGMRNLTAATVTATCNWWGASTGPSGSGAGSGDAVIGTLTYSPFAVSSIAGTAETTCAGS